MLESNMVDIMMSFPVQTAMVRADTTCEDYPKMQAFLKRMQERPAYQRVVEKFGRLGVGDS
jgi:glutathione S-transferase